LATERRLLVEEVWDRLIWRGQGGITAHGEDLAPVQGSQDATLLDLALVVRHNILQNGLKGIRNEFCEMGPDML
jgi:hypothetical protein